MSPSLYTGKGDDGSTKFFGCDQKRVSKSSAVAEALGALDEVNSFLGLVKVGSKDAGFALSKKSFESIVHGLQESLFIIQAELAGADKCIERSKVEELEAWIKEVEEELPPIKTFFISGGTELAARFDVARTLARRAERRVVGVNDEGVAKIGAETLRYLNRLSSMLYALARLTNHRSGVEETPPSYK